MNRYNCEKTLHCAAYKHVNSEKCPERLRRHFNVAVNVLQMRHLNYRHDLDAMYRVMSSQLSEVDYVNFSKVGIFD